MYTKTITLFAFMATALAAPQVGGAFADDNELTVSDAALQCGNNQALSCCTQGSSNDATGFLGGLLDGLLGGACQPFAIAGAGGSVPINDACGNNIAACCTGDQDGLVNIACSPISVFKKN